MNVLQPSVFHISVYGTKHLVKIDNLGKSFQDYSWIQDFEADFP